MMTVGASSLPTVTRPVTVFMATSWLGQQHTLVRSEDVHYRLWRHQGLSGVPERRTLQRGR